MNFKTQIAIIDKEITAIQRTVKQLEKIDLYSAESWQAAWDKHPELRIRETQYFILRGWMQRFRDDADAPAIAKKEMHRKMSESKSARQRSRIFSYLYDCKRSAEKLGLRGLAEWYSAGTSSWRML